MGPSGKEDSAMDKSSDRENETLEQWNTSTIVCPRDSEENSGSRSPSARGKSESDGVSVVNPIGSEVVDHRIQEQSSLRSHHDEGCESGALASGFHAASERSSSFRPPLSALNSQTSSAEGRFPTRGNCRDLGLAERLASILSSPGEGDLLFRPDGSGTKILQWLQALDQQTIGGCRADERLNPLFKLNVSGGVVEDHLLAYLRQNFEAAEVGMLARCLCVPLASIRVGKVIKQGSLLCPSAIRGHLKLILLPSSDFHLSFVGDNGCEERLALFSCYDENFSITVEGIPADTSGTSFLVKVPSKVASYYWLSEKSMTTGTEFLEKMKDLLQRKPSLSQLTGICDSRLNSLGEYLRSYFLHSTATSYATPITNSTVPPTSCQIEESTPSTKHSTHSRPTLSQSSSVHSPYQGSLSPRTSTFKEGFSRILSSSRFDSSDRDKARRRGEVQSSFSDDAQLVSCSPLDDSCPPASSIAGENDSQTDNVETTATCSGCCSPLLIPPGRLLVSDSFCSSMVSLLNPSLQRLSLPEVQPSNSLSPYYCWCPPHTSTLPYTAALPHVPLLAADSSTLPSLSSSGNSNVLVASSNSVDVASKPEFPDFLSDALVRMPLPVSPLIPVPSSQQIPSFTPFISDPIVHIPVIDVCSSGQLYLVSAGPSISTTISPLLPSLVNKLIPESEVEKGARETLRMLISSSQSILISSSQNMPEFLTGMDENLLRIHDKKQGALVGGSRGLYSGCFQMDKSIFCSPERSNDPLPDADGSDCEASETSDARSSSGLSAREEHHGSNDEAGVSTSRVEKSSDKIVVVLFDCIIQVSVTVSAV